MSLIDSLMPGLNQILGIRDQIGAGLKKVSFVTRTWTGFEPGDGQAQDTVQPIDPTPMIVDFSHNERIQSGGVIQQGDVLLRHISKKSYPQKEMVDGLSLDKSVEKFYDIGGSLYQVISVKENHLTWDVQVRRLSDQTRY